MKHFLRLLIGFSSTQPHFPLKSSPPRVFPPNYLATVPFTEAFTLLLSYPSTLSTLFHTLSRPNLPLNPLSTRLLFRLPFPPSLSPFQLTQLLHKLSLSSCSLSLDFFSLTLKHSAVSSPAPFNAFLASLTRDRGFPRMNLLFSQMKRMNIIPNVVTYDILIDHFCKSRCVNDALNVFDEMSTRDVAVCNMVVDGLGKAGRVGEALGVLDRSMEI